MRNIVTTCAALGVLMFAASPANAATLNMMIDTVDQTNGYDITLTGLTTDGSNVAMSLVNGTVTGFGTDAFLTGSLSLITPGSAQAIALSGVFSFDGVVTSTAPYFSNTASSGILLADSSASAFLNPYNGSGTLYDSFSTGGGASNPGDLVTVSVSETPIPAAQTLFASALVVLFGFMGWQKRKASLDA